MKRLTEWDEFGNADIIALSDMMPEIYAELSFSETNALTEALNRLAKYEDTGLEPNQAMLISNVLREVGETYNCWFDYVVNCVLENSHLKDLAQAEKDGRLVVLPCSLHQPLYILKNEEICRNYGCQWHFTDKESQTFGTLSMYGEFVSLDDFGKIVFLTREEAEAALKKREAGNETD